MSKHSMIPKQAAPIKRHQLVKPHTTVDVVNGSPEELFLIYLGLLYGANYDEPGYFDEIAALQRACCIECGLTDLGLFF